MVISQLSVEQLKAYEVASALWSLRGTPLARYDLTKCPTIIKNGMGYNIRYIGKQCVSRAGRGTSHDDYGQCIAHGGAKKYGRALGGWLMAHAFAEEYDLSPWESLLYVIRITAGRVKYCERVLGTARDDRELIGGRTVVVSDGAGGVSPLGLGLGVESGGPNDGALIEARDLSWWVETSERERVLLAKVSKAAIDAGVAQLLVTREIEQGDLMADSYIRVYDALEAAGADEDVLMAAREAMKKELMQLGAKDGTSQVRTNHHTPGMIEIEGPKDTGLGDK